jgi:hypothetical protein
MKKYSIYAALREDVNSGWIWTNVPDFRQRSVVCLQNPKTRKKVYCEILRIDKNFLKYYNDKDGGRLTINNDFPTLVMNEWYRTLLGDLTTRSEYELQISDSDNLKGRLMASVHHPQIVVRVAFWLGVISVILGVVGLGLGIISLV